MTETAQALVVTTATVAAFLEAVTSLERAQVLKVQVQGDVTVNLSPVRD